MPSNASSSFKKNAKDIERLLWFHENEGGSGQGRRYGLEVLNKSAIVLLTSFWEAYCEDIAAEALAHIVRHCPTSQQLPIELRKIVAKDLKAEAHDLAVWKLSDTGWRQVLQDRLANLQEERNRRLNTPKTAQINKLFEESLGIQDISSRWHWSGMTVAVAKAKLDRYVEMRGAIAHRGAGARAVTKSHVTSYFKFLRRLVGRTGGGVYRHIKSITPVRLWQ